MAYDLGKEIELEEMREKMEKWREGEEEETERSGRSKKRSDSLKVRTRSRNKSLGARSLSDDRTSSRDRTMSVSDGNGKRSRSPLKRDLLGLAKRLGQVSLESSRTEEMEEGERAEEGRTEEKESRVAVADMTHVSNLGPENGSNAGRESLEQEVDAVEGVSFLDEAKAVVRSGTEALGAGARPKMEKWKKAIRKVKEVVKNEGDEKKEGSDERVIFSPSQTEGKNGGSDGEEESGINRWGMPRALNHAQTEIYSSGHLSEVEEVPEDEDPETNFGAMTVEELMKMDTKMREQFNQVCNENDALIENIAQLKYEHEAQKNHNAEKWAIKQQEYEQQILDREGEIEKLEWKIDSMRGDSMEAKTTKEMLDKKYAEAAVMMNTIDKQEEELKSIKAQLEKERKKRMLDISELEQYRETLEEQKRETESLRKMRNHLEGNMKKSDRRLKKRNPSMLSLNRGGDIMVIDNGDDGEGDLSSSSSSEETEGEEDREEQDVRRKKDGGKKKGMSREQARREIKDYIWPNMSDFTTEEGFKNMFKKQIMRAKQNGIPKKTIANSVCMALLKNKRTADMYSELCEQFDTTSLSGVLKIIDNLDSEQNSRNATERFYEINMDESETARSYLGRLKRAHRALFPKESDKETNMIRKQFLEGFRYKGEELSDSDKKYLYNTPELNDLCTRTMFVVKENLDKEKKKEGGRDRKDRQYRELNTVDYDIEATGQRRMESVQTTYRGRPNNGPPAPRRDDRQGQRYYETQGGQAYGPRRPAGQQRVPAIQASGGARESVDPRDRVSAGPNAERVSVEEYKKGQATNGDRVCYRCCTRNHIAFDCPFVAYCVFCKKETNHPSIRHDDVMANTRGNSA